MLENVFTLCELSKCQSSYACVEKCVCVCNYYFRSGCLFGFIYSFVFNFFGALLLEFAGIDQRVLLKALRILEQQGKAKVCVNIIFIPRTTIAFLGFFCFPRCLACIFF